MTAACRQNQYGGWPGGIGCRPSIRAVCGAPFFAKILFLTIEVPVCEKYQLKHLEYDILMFLHNNPQYRTAADIVRVRKSTKSHVSTSLKTLEDRGLIAKKTDPVNKKHIELDLLEPANEIVQDGLLAQRQFAEQMLRGLTPEDIAVCKRVFQQVCSNAEACIKQKG